ncbi:MAG: tryptophan--tRNA ligase [Candidatus Aenigmarchaeota archaeon]|nr:tryptophan--tRNA ligase [Candidatus Aenigmarchaeota archaeon]
MDNVSKITPWEVEGKIDYDRIVKEFGLKEIDDAILEKIKSFTGDLHVLLRRKYFFAHRDLDVVLDEAKTNGFFLYTGRGPSGPMHIGHLIPFMFTKWLQDKFKVNVYIELTDDEKFLEPKRKLSLEETRKWAYENILDIIAVGFDENRTFIFQDTEYIRNMYPLAIKIAKKINFSTVKAVFGFKNETNIGLIFFPALEIVPTFFEDKICLIPAAVDQDPFWRLQRDVADALGRRKSAQIHSKFLPPLTGIEGKMSASKPESSIYLTDDEKTVREKIYKHAFSGGQPTIELHRKLGGNPDVDVSFQWLKTLFEEDDNKLKKIEEDYRSGKLLTGELKDILIEKIVKFLQEHQRKREEAKERVKDFKYDGKLAKEMWEKIHE